MIQHLQDRKFYEVVMCVPTGSSGVSGSGNPPTRCDWSILSLAMVALQIQWAFEYALMTPMLLRSGLHPGVASLSWIPSPILQLLLNPWLGRWSDSLPRSPVGPGAEYSGVDSSSSPLLGGGGRCRREPFFWAGGTRRHPFLLATAGLSTAILVVLGLSEIADGDDGKGGANWGYVLLLVVGFVAIDFSNSVNETFQRSLFTDVADLSAKKGAGAAEDSRVIGHSYLGSAAGFGSFVGYLLAGTDLDRVFGGASAAAVLFLGGAAIFVPAQALMLWWSIGMMKSSSAPEIFRDRGYSQVDRFELDIGRTGGTDAIDHNTSLALQHCDRSESGDVDLKTCQSERISETPFHEKNCTLSIDNDIELISQNGTCNASLLQIPDRSWLEEVHRFPKPFRFLCLQQLLAWLGLWPIWLFATAYFGGSVYSGSPTDPIGSEGREAYDAGVRSGSLACAALGLSSSVVGVMLLPTLSRWLGMRATYVLMQAAGGASILGLYVVRCPVWSTVLVATTGLSWAANNCVPYAVIQTFCNKSDDDSNSEDDIALYTNVLYIVQTLPQLLGAIVLGPIVEACGGDYAVAMAIAGVCGLLGAVFGVFWIPPSIVTISEGGDRQQQHPSDCD